MKEKIRRLSEKILKASSGIGIISALSWKPSVKNKFFENKFKINPQITPEDYTSLEYDIIEKIGLFQEILDDIDDTLGFTNPVGKILKETAEGWLNALYLIQSRGTPMMHELSKVIYGHPNEKLFGKTILESAEALKKLADQVPFETKSVSSKNMRDELEFRLKYYFGDDAPKIYLSNSLDSDAAAGNGTIIIRSGAHFTDKDIDVFEVHEGKIHILTEINGDNQPYAKWLSQVSPRTEGFQEGIAAFAEFISGISYPKRIKKLANRVIAIAMVENGADFVTMFNWHKKLGMDDNLAWNSTERIFKGSTPDGHFPFTRDISYLKNLLIVNKLYGKLFKKNKIHLFNRIINGYITHNDLKVLIDLEKNGIINAPKFIPEFFNNPSELLSLLKHI